MINNKAIGYITANYAGTEKSALVESRSIASVPFIGRYRLIDFPLSNMANAGIRTVGLVLPGNWRSILDHVGHGKDWMLDRKKGGLFPVPGNPYGTTKQGMRFLLRDIISNKELFQRSDKPYVVMMASNIIFNLELDEIIDAHERSGAGLTMVYVKAERKHTDCSRLIIGDRGRVQKVEPGCEYGDNKFIDCFVVNRDLLLQIIERYQSADYLDLFEAIAGDFSLIDVCSYEFKGLAIGILLRPLHGASEPRCGRPALPPRPPDHDEGARRAAGEVLHGQQRHELAHLGRLRDPGHGARLHPGARRHRRERRERDEQHHHAVLRHQERCARGERHPRQGQHGAGEHRAARHARLDPRRGQEPDGVIGAA